MKRPSLRRTTFTALAGPTVIAVLLVSFSGLWSAERSISILRDNAMTQEAEFLMMLSLHEAAEGERLGVIRSSESDRLRQLRGGGTGFRIWSGSVVMTASGAGTVAAAASPPSGFGIISGKGQEWRRFALAHERLPITVEILEPTAMRSEMALRMAATMTWPMLLLILAASWIAWRAIASALRPILQVSHDIDTRDSDDLQPLVTDDLPVEIAPFVVAVNDLMRRLGQAIEREREFTDNAAHELRTPLALLKVRAQIAERALADRPSSQAELAQLVAAIDRATGVIEQLLTLARVQADRPAFGPIDLSGLTEAIARDLAPDALARRQQIDARITPGIRVNGNSDALAMVVRNLIDNAIRYTPVGGMVNIELEARPDGNAVLRIVDDGPGIPAEKLDRAFERFTRFAAAENGSGLGLAIAQKIVERHGGAVSLANRSPHGLICEARLPAAK